MLYNLYLGEKRPPDGFATVRIGPFKVEVVSNYNDIVPKLPQRATIISNLWGGESQYIPEKIGEWVATCECTLVGKSERSILANRPADDGGIWDLCQILTFLNGRNVTDHPEERRFDPNDIGEKACIDIEILRAAQVMWNNRGILVKRKLKYALLLFNGSLSCNNINSKALVINPAFNGVYDDWLRQLKAEARENGTDLAGGSGGIIDLTSGEKEQVIATMNSALESIETISEIKIEPLSMILGSKVLQGLITPVNLIQAMLCMAGIIPENPGEDIKKRIKFINTLRNKFVHSGAPPIFKENPELSIELSGFIACRLIPDLIQMYLGKIVGFTTSSVGSLSQHTEEFSNYFKNGIYEGLAVEVDKYADILNEKFDM